MSTLAHRPWHWSSWWRHLRAAWNSPSWPAVLAAFVVLGLLAAFERVVSGAVEQGQLRRAAVAANINDTWRCKALQRLSERDGCLVQLGDAPHPTAKPARGTIVLTTLEH